MAHSGYFSLILFIHVQTIHIYIYTVYIHIYTYIYIYKTLCKIKHHITSYNISSFKLVYIQMFMFCSISCSCFVLPVVKITSFSPRSSEYNIHTCCTGFYVFSEIPAHLTAVNATVAYTLQHYMAFSITQIDAHRRTQCSQALTSIVRLDTKAKNCLFRSGASTFWELR